MLEWSPDAIQLLEQLMGEDVEPRGEFVLVLAGKSESEIKAELEEEFSALTVEEHLKDLINKGMDKKEAIKTVAKMRNIPKKEVYKSAIDL